MQASIGGQTLDTSKIVKQKFNLFNFQKPTPTPTATIGGVGVSGKPQASIGGQIMPTIIKKQPLQKASIGPIGVNKQILQATTQPVTQKSFIDDLEYDIKNGATEEEIIQAYPEIKGNTKLASEIVYDIKNGATKDQVKQAYPELDTSKYQKRYFSDEKSIVDKMLQEGYTEDIARETITNRRNDYLKNTKLDNIEAQILINMADQGVDMPSSVKMLNDFRKDIKEKQYNELNPAQKVLKTYLDRFVDVVGGGVGEIGGIVDFATQGRSELGKMAMEGRETQREISQGETGSKVADMLGSAIIDYYGGKTLLKTPLGKGATIGSKYNKLGTTGKLIVGGATGGALTMAGETGAETTTEDLGKGALLGAGGGLVLGKVALPVLSKTYKKGVEVYQMKKNPLKYQSKIDDETVKLVRQAVRPSISGVDTAKKFDIQDEKLLQGVKEVIKQGKIPTNGRQLMEAVEQTKKNLWSKVSEANKSVVRTTNGEDVGLKLRQFVNDPENKTTFLSRPELKSTLLKYADDIGVNTDFKNISQEQLQEILTDINSRIPANSFLKQLDANPTETAKNSILAKIYRDIVDDNLEEAVGKAGAEARRSYGAVRQLEKDFAKRYGVYLRQNPKGIADMFGMEGFADIATGLLTASPGQVLRGTVIQGAKRLIKNANNPDTIIRDIFKLQRKVKGANSTFKIPKEQLKITQGKKSPIITPQTLDKARILESKAELSKAKIVNPQSLKVEKKKLLKRPLANKDSTIKTEVIQPQNSVKLMPLKNELGSVKKPLVKREDIPQKVKFLHLNGIRKNELVTDLEKIAKYGFTKDDLELVGDLYLLNAKGESKLKGLLGKLPDGAYGKYESPFSNRSGYINPSAIVDDITKVIKAPKKLLSRKINAPKELIEEAKKYRSGEDMYQRLSGDKREIFQKQGVRYKSEYEDWYNKNLQKGEDILDTVNPTGGLYVDYTPEKRANSLLSSKKLATLSETSGKSETDTITIYRGTVKSQKDMNPGDFITTNIDLANAYSGDNVISKKVKYSDIIDDKLEPLGEEYLYIPKSMQKWK